MYSGQGVKLMTEEESITKFISAELMRHKEKSTLEITDNLIEGGIIDSLGIQKLIAYLESSYAITISDIEVLPENFETVRSISSFVRNKTTGRKENVRP
jgi:acyl carrier protein